VPARTEPGLWRLGTIRPDLWRPRPANYFWRNRYEAVMFRFVPDDRGGGYFDLLSLDARPTEPGGCYSSLEAFNERNASLLTARTQRGAGDRRPPLPPVFCPSPDGELLAWIARISKRQLHWVAASLDGRERFAWRLEPEPGCRRFCPAWWGDSRSCVMLFVGSEEPSAFTHAVRRDLDRPSGEMTVRFDALREGVFCGVDHWGRMILHHNSPEAGEVIRLSAVDLAHRTATVTEIGVRVPSPGKVTEVAPCPDRPQLGWIAEPDEPEAHYEIWTGGLEGEAPRRLVSLPGFTEWSVRGAAGTQLHYPTDLAWIPGEAWLSFRHGHALWAVPAAADER
jgi:hypothetical protein